ncbi:MAG: YggT family protein [Planctomycetes bacterium]|nr:YggT family protein [Planctomycetota bacterium]
MPGDGTRLRKRIHAGKYHSRALSFEDSDCVHAPRVDVTLVVTGLLLEETNSMLDFLAAVIDLYSLVLLVRVIFTWLPPRHRQNEFYEFMRSITEPALRPIRRVLPTSQRIDFSPLVLLLLLRLVANLLRGA